jgi:hypothetical protein
MSFLVGFLGFISGFSLAILVLNMWLRDVPREVLLQNKSMQLRYGLLTWSFAFIVAYAAVTLYRYYYLS